MVDELALLRAFLLQVTAVTDLVGTGNINGGIYGGGDLPERFDPKLGPGILLSGRGGPCNPDTAGIVETTVHIRVWADVSRLDVARAVYGAIWDALNGVSKATISNFGTIILAYEGTHGQDITDPDTGWVTVLSIWRIMARA